MFAKVFTNSSAPSLLRQQAKEEFPYFVSVHFQSGMWWKEQRKTIEG